MATLTAKILADFTTSLASAMAIGATTATLQSATDDDGIALVTGTYYFTLDGANSSKEHIRCTLTGTALTAIYSISRQGVATSGCVRAHRLGATVSLTDFAHIFIINNLINGTTQLDASNPLSYDGTATISSANQLATKAYIDGIAIAGSPDATTSTKGIGRVSVAPVSAGTPIFVGDNDYRVGANNYAADAGANDIYVITLTNAPAAYVTGQEYVFKANTANTGTASLNVNTLGAKTIVRSDGTTLLTGDILANQIVVCKYNGTNMIMVSNPAATVNLVAGVYPAGDGTAITGVALSKASYTASGAIVANDTVYVSAANTVKSIYPSAQGTGATIATAPTSVLAPKCMPLSTNGLYLHITGGTTSTAGGLKAQVRTMNAAETDFANGTEQAIYTTGNGVQGWDVCSIGTDKFLFIFQANTAGAAAGIKAVVATVSGTTVTVGSVQGIETTGNLSWLPACSKVDVDKGAIFYNKDSDGDLYVQVLTVSTTTITTNTPVLVKVMGGGTISVVSDQYSTNNVATTYCEAGPNTVIYGRTVSISGTTPTVNAEQTLVSTASVGIYTLGLRFISTTKFLFSYWENSIPASTKIAHIALSGATMTLSSTISGTAGRNCMYYGMNIIGTKYALFCEWAASTSMTLFLIDISGTAPVQISTQGLGYASITTYYANSIVKVAPWTYMVTSSASDSDYIVKLTVVSTARIGVAEAAIADTAAGNILYRYLTQTLSGVTLTAGSIYYADETGQPTINSSLTAPTLGIAISTTKILLQ